MSEVQNKPPAEPKTLGVIAQFPDAHDLVAAARKTTDHGYRKVDAFSPFPIHGVDDALRAPKTILPWVVFCGGVLGCLTALGIQYYMNAMEFQPAGYYSGYPFDISDKPMFSLPANIPVTFELIILFSSFAAFFGMLGLNGLPKLHNPLFKSEAFSRVTNDGFFLWVDSRDEKFDLAQTTDWLNSIGATHVEAINEEVKGKEVPAFLLALGAVGAAVALVPPFWIAAAAGTSSQPRLSIWWDMDHQTKLKPQTETNLFADTASMRKAIPGTVARGGLKQDLYYYEGQAPAEGAASLSGVRASFVSLQEEDAEAGAAAAETAPAEVKDENLADGNQYAQEFPLKVTDGLMSRGQQRFNIYCATCHGMDGYGDGLVTRRAMELKQPTWTRPLSLHDKAVREQPVGKLFATVTHGVRRMPGYGKQLSVKDRWAIVLYLQALQRSQHASLEEIPEDMRPAAE